MNYAMKEIFDENVSVDQYDDVRLTLASPETTMLTKLSLITTQNYRQSCRIQYLQ